MNTIAKRSAASSAIASLSSLKSGLQNVASTIVTAGGTPILRLLKDGAWVYGAENVEVEGGSRWAVNPYSLMHGYVAWTDKPGNQPNEIVGEVMVPMTTPLPLQTELQDVAWPWKQQLSVELKCTNGVDTGETVVYKVTSVGGMNAIKTLIAALMGHLDEDPETPVAVVQLEHDTYMHKKHGKVYVPMFGIVSWVDLDGVQLDDAEDEAEAEAEAVEEVKAAPAAQARTRRAAAPAEAAKPAAEQTVAATAADRKAALLAQIAALEADGAEDAEVAEEPAEPAADAPRRRRRA